MSKRYFLATHTDLDGVGCAVLAYLAFGEENVDVEYCDYKDIDKKVMVLGDNSELYKSYDKIFITDISVSERLAQDLDIACDHKKITLLDHHATAEYLNKYDWCNVRVTDECGVKTSGTMMFFRYLSHRGFFNKYNERVRLNICKFAKTVRDYDTWRWKEVLSEEEGIVCKQLNDLFHIYGRGQFIEWANHIIRVRDVFPMFDMTDVTLLENKQKDIDNYIAMKNKQLMTVKDNFGYTCGVVFAERYMSELGNRLSELHPELDYIAMIDIGFGGVSYRTVREDIDLGGTVAHSFGGGGHRKAAGSSFDVGAIKDAVIHFIFDIDSIIA